MEIALKNLNFCAGQEYTEQRFLTMGTLFGKPIHIVPYAQMNSDAREKKPISNNNNSKIIEQNKT
jgi:hypothetical protein